MGVKAVGRPPHPPAELAGLGFLPPDVNLLAAVQPGPIFAHAERTNQDPRELLSKAGVPDAVFTTLNRAGLTLPQIDHVVVGTNAREFPRLVVVLVLRRPLPDEDAFLHALDARPDPQGRANRLVAQLANLPMELVRVSDRVWVFGLGDKDLTPLGRGGSGTGAGHLSLGLQEMLSQRLPPDAAAWAAADSDRWAENPLIRA